jgi:hypothetical protein
MVLEGRAWAKGPGGVMSWILNWKACILHIYGLSGVWFVAHGFCFDFALPI